MPQYNEMGESINLSIDIHFCKSLEKLFCWLILGDSNSVFGWGCHIEYKLHDRELHKQIDKDRRLVEVQVGK